MVREDLRALLVFRDLLEIQALLVLQGPQENLAQVDRQDNQVQLEMLVHQGQLDLVGLRAQEESLVQRVSPDLDSLDLQDHLDLLEDLVLQVIQDLLVRLEVRDLEDPQENLVLVVHKVQLGQVVHQALRDHAVHLDHLDLQELLVSQDHLDQVDHVGNQELEGHQDRLDQ